MKIKYKVKEFSEDPRTLKDGDWFTVTEKFCNYSLVKGNAYKFKRFTPKATYPLDCYFNNAFSAFGVKTLEEIKRVRVNDPNYKLTLKHD